MNNLFDNIRPYTAQETLVAVKKIFSEPKFLQHLSIFKDKINVNEWINKVLACKTRHEFYLTFAEQIFYYFAEKTCSQLHFSGIENINPKNQ
jgi:hypothetical protein